MSVPFLSTTTTSRLTRSTSIEMGLPVCGISWQVGNLRGGKVGSRVSARSLRQHDGSSQEEHDGQSVIRSRMGLISVASLSECTFTAQDFDLPLPRLIDADLQQRQRPAADAASSRSSVLWNERSGATITSNAGSSRISMPLK